MADTATRSLSYGSIILLLVLLLGAGLAVYWHRVNNIEVIHPVRGPAVQAVYATGTVEASVMLPIAPRITARLIALRADEGMEVKKDQVLAELEDRDLRQTIKELQANEAFAEDDFRRKKELRVTGVIPQSEYDRARTNWEAAKAAVAHAAVELEFMKLIAPAAGRIIRRDGEVGQLIPANQPVFWLTCCSELRISAEVDEEDIALVQPGQKVLIRADAFPGRIFHGEVRSITPKGDPVARSYRVRIGFTETTPLMIGMTAETNIIIHETEDALLVPSSAVTKGSLWLVEEGKLLRREVEIGADGLKQTEIIKGVSENDLIVPKPTPELREGKKVNARLTIREE
jgi:multidrug efflux system membrane fusion protein